MFDILQMVVASLKPALSEIGVPEPWLTGSLQETHLFVSAQPGLGSEEGVVQKVLALELLDSARCALPQLGRPILSVLPTVRRLQFPDHNIRLHPLHMSSLILPHRTTLLATISKVERVDIFSTAN